MGFLVELWLPILLSAVIVFAASSVVHMVLQWHKKDCSGLKNDEEVRAALRKGSAAPGMYFTPYAGSMKEASSPEFRKKCEEGPVALMIVSKPGAPNMGPQLLQWFVLSVGVSIVAAYLAARTVGVGGTYLQVFRVVGTLSFMAYGCAYVPWSIWYKLPWGSTLRYLADALIYGLLTAGVFGWLWPR